MASSQRRGGGVGQYGGRGAGGDGGGGPYASGPYGGQGYAGAGTGTGSGPRPAGQSPYIPSSQQAGVGSNQQPQQQHSAVPQPAHHAPQHAQPQQPAWFDTTSYGHRGSSEPGMPHQVQQQQQHGQYEGYSQGQQYGQGGGYNQEGHRDSFGDRQGNAGTVGSMGAMGSAANQKSAGQPYDTYASAQINGEYSLKSGAGRDDDDDLPLLEELGIDLPAILHRIKAILTFRYSSADATSLDLGGPIIFMSIFATCHLLVGKLHFGYILGWMVMGSVLLWFILSSMAAGGSVDGYERYDDGQGGDGHRLDLYSCCSIVGYSLLPLVLHAGLSLLFPRRSLVTYIVAVVAVGWATAAAAQLFIMRGQEGLKGKKMVVAYPCALMYTAFALLTLY